MNLLGSDTGEGPLQRAYIKLRVNVSCAWEVAIIAIFPWNVVAPPLEMLLHVSATHPNNHRQPSKSCFMVKGWQLLSLCAYTYIICAYKCSYVIFQPLVPINAILKILLHGKGLAVVHCYVCAHALFVHTNRLSIIAVYACACS